MLAITPNIIFIERLGHGGFVITNPPDDERYPSTRIAAFTTLDEVLKFVKTDVWPDEPVIEQADAVPLDDEGYTAWGGGLHLGPWPAGLAASDLVDVVLRNCGVCLRARVGGMKWTHRDPFDADRNLDILRYRRSR